MPYAQRAVVNGFLRFPLTTSGRPTGIVDDPSRKRKRDGATTTDLDADRARLREEIDAELASLVREFDTRCAKCLREGHSSLRTHAHLCGPGIAHTDANSWAVLDAKLELPREDLDAMLAQRAVILKGKRKIPPPHRGGGGHKPKRGGGRGGRGGASDYGNRGQGFRQGLSGGSRN